MFSWYLGGFLGDFATLLGDLFGDFLGRLVISLVISLVILVVCLVTWSYVYLILFSSMKCTYIDSMEYTYFLWSLAWSLGQLIGHFWHFPWSFGRLVGDFLGHLVTFLW